MPNVARSATQSLSVGQTILFGGSIVVASLTGFYLNLRRIHNKKMERGDVPHYEYLMSHIASRGLANPVPGAAEVPLSRHILSGKAFSPPQKEHHHRHLTIKDYQPSPTSDEIRGRLEQPTPQRPKAVGSSLVYTKSPEYVKSYEKIRAKKEGVMPTLERTEVPEVLGASP